VARAGWPSSVATEAACEGEEGGVGVLHAEVEKDGVGVGNDEGGATSLQRVGLCRCRSGGATALHHDEAARSASRRILPFFVGIIPP
jgi:hypothetical protein